MSNRQQNQILNTYNALKEEFGHSLFVRLDQISETYLGMKPSTAKRRAAEDALPFPATRFGDSQKSPWVVKLTTLAQFIDNKFRADYDEWSKVKY